MSNKTLTNLCSIILIAFCLCGNAFAQKKTGSQNQKPVVKIKFTDVREIRKLPGTNSLYSANLTIDGSTVYVEFEEAGAEKLKFYAKRMTKYRQGDHSPLPPNWVYGTEEEFDLQNTFGRATHETGYRLVGSHEIASFGVTKYEW